MAPVDPPSTKLAWPSAHLMKEPDPLPDIKEGDDLYTKLAESRAESAKDRAQVKGLQRYVRLIHKKRAP